MCILHLNSRNPSSEQKQTSGSRGKGLGRGGRKEARRGYEVDLDVELCLLSLLGNGFSCTSLH